MRKAKPVICPDCGDSVEIAPVDRRDFLKNMTAAAAAAVSGGVTLWATPAEARPTPTSAAETLVKTLYGTLTEAQKKEICFAWDYRDTNPDPKQNRGLLRTHVSNNWHITRQTIDSNFYTSDQKQLAMQIFKSIINPDWHERIMKQLKDDNNGKPWGADQNIAIFGTPGDKDKFELVMTGRHMTIRADGGSESHVALGGPIFHGHAASGFNERVGHPGNVFWHQALEANKVFTMLDGKQQEKALVKRRPAEAAVNFRAKDSPIPGIPCTELSRDQKAGVEKVLQSLIEPYRQEDRDEVMECLKKMGGLDRCHLTFYEEGDLGDDREWDNWRLEGPSFVWYFRGTPHVHIWINVADDASVQLNAKG